MVPQTNIGRLSGARWIIGAGDAMPARIVPERGPNMSSKASLAGRSLAFTMTATGVVASAIVASQPSLAQTAPAEDNTRQFLERYCDTDTLFCTMHFPSPSVGHIDRWGHGFRPEYLT